MSNFDIMKIFREAIKRILWNFGHSLKRGGGGSGLKKLDFFWGKGGEVRGLV